MASGPRFLRSRRMNALSSRTRCWKNPPAILAPGSMPGASDRLRSVSRTLLPGLFQGANFRAESLGIGRRPYRT